MGMGNQKVRSLLVVADSIFAGTDRHGVFRSQNGGRTWALSNDGIPARAQIFAMSAVGNTVFAGLYTRGLYRWNEVNSKWDKVGRVKPLVLAAAGDAVVAGHNPGGVFWSTDAGETWTDGSAGLPVEAPIWAMGGTEQRLFAGAADGIFSSRDRGRNWTRARQGLPASSPGVAFLATAGLVLAAVIIE